MYLEECSFLCQFLAAHHTQITGTQYYQRHPTDLQSSLANPSFEHLSQLSSLDFLLDCISSPFLCASLIQTFC